MDSEDEDLVLALEFFGMSPEARREFLSGLTDEERAQIKAAFQRAFELKKKSQPN